MLFGKGAFRQETLPVGGAGLLDRTVTELTDAADRRGEKAQRLSTHQIYPRFDHIEQSCLYSQACGKRTSYLRFESHLCVSNNLNEQRVNCMFSEYNLLLFYWELCLLPVTTSIRTEQAVFVVTRDLTVSCTTRFPNIILRIWFYSWEGKRLQLVPSASWEVGVDTETVGRGDHRVDLTHYPSTGVWTAHGFTSCLCLFLQSASEGRFLPFETEEPGICFLQSPVNVTQRNDSSSQKYIHSNWLPGLTVTSHINGR